jgi:hypothetical protein
MFQTQKAHLMIGVQKKIAPPENSPHRVPIIFQTPIWLQELFFRPYFIFAPSSPRHYFLPPLCHSFYSTTTNERTNELTNEQTVNLFFSRRVHLLHTITNFLPFASFLFLLTPDRLRR